MDENEGRWIDRVQNCKRWAAQAGSLAWRAVGEAALAELHDLNEATRFVRDELLELGELLEDVLLLQGLLAAFLHQRQQAHKQ